MQAKEFMQQVRKAESELKLIAMKRRHYEDLAASIGVKLTGMPSGSGGGSRVETAAVGLTILTSQLTEKEKEYAALVRKAEKLIDKIPQEKFRKVLTLRYLCGISWRSIQDEMAYNDEKSVYRCNGYALKELQKLM